MKLFVDEDTGASVGRALRQVGVDCALVARDGFVTPGTPDIEWIPRITRENRLILSRNSQMLAPRFERQILIENKAALVLLPQHLSALALLRLILSRWDCLELAWQTETRPFAFRVALNGHLKREDLSLDSVRHRSSAAPRRPRVRRLRTARGKNQMVENDWISDVDDRHGVGESEAVRDQVALALAAEEIADAIRKLHVRDGIDDVFGKLPVVAADEDEADRL
ncbi:MAG: hypothetical protein EPO26_10915 [Chloroflexota bacterium]|nr:MAG: hypothetical protein EPO26_10915 [Chloroflexota bacterium]